MLFYPLVYLGYLLLIFHISTQSFFLWEALLDLLRQNLHSLL